MLEPERKRKDTKHRDVAWSAAELHLLRTCTFDITSVVPLQLVRPSTLLSCKPFKAQLFNPAASNVSRVRASGSHRDREMERDTPSRHHHGHFVDFSTSGHEADYSRNHADASFGILSMCGTVLPSGI